MSEQTQDREAVERAARALAGLTTDEPWPTSAALGGGPTGTRDDEYRAAMIDQADAALSAAGWDETQAEVKRLREAWAIRRDDVIRLLNDNTVSHVERINGADDLLRLPLLLAETGQPGEGLDVMPTATRTGSSWRPDWSTRGQRPTDDRR